MITSFHLKWRTRKLSRCVKCVLSAHVNLQIMKFGSAEAENSLSLDRATDDCQPVPSLSPPLRMNEWATKILPSAVLRMSSATYLTVKSLYLSERIPQRYKFTLRRSAARSPGGAVLKGRFCFCSVAATRSSCHIPRARDFPPPLARPEVPRFGSLGGY